MRRSPLPPSLGPAFRVADAADLGVARSRLRAKDVSAPFRGTRVRSDQQLPDERPGLDRVRAHVRELAAVYALIMPANQFFSHLTAAILWRLPLPIAFLLAAAEGIPTVRLLDVSVYAPVRTPRAKGIRGHQVLSSHATLREKDGLRLMSPASTWAVFAGLAQDLRDLVAMGDAIVRQPIFSGDPPPLATLPELRAAAAVGRRRGVGMLRQALPLIRTRSASPQETFVRMLLTAAGLPEPALNYEIWVRGALLACVDLAYPELKIAIEYEGEHHLLNPAQWAKDIERHARLVENGWIVIRVTKGDITAPAQLIARISRAVASRR